MADLMVARGGIEPPTRGFSVLGTPAATSSRSRLFNDRIHEYLDQIVHGICPSLLGLAISLPVQGAFVLPVWVPVAKLSGEVIKALRSESGRTVLQLQNIWTGRRSSH